MPGYEHRQSVSIIFTLDHDDIRITGDEWGNKQVDGLLPSLIEVACSSPLRESSLLRESSSSNGTISP